MRGPGGIRRSGWLLLLAVLIAGCTHSVEPEDVAGAGPAGGVPTGIVVGSFDFPESVLLANVYAQALTAAGLPSQVLPSVGNRELVEPALMNGLIQVLPEYAGSALDFLSLGAVPPSADEATTHTALSGSAASRGLVAAAPAAGQNKNAIVVTRETATRYGLDSVDDLTRVAPELSFGGPPECPQRKYCLLGLERTYGLTFHDFVPTDAGGQLTRQALSAGHIDVALLFTTDPTITAQRLVVLKDSRGLQPAENITPLVAREAVDRSGGRVLDVLNAVSSRLTTETLRTLNSRMAQPGAEPAGIAVDWLRSQGMIRAEQAAS